MEFDHRIQYFLGSNSVRGFASLYQNFCRPETGEFLWVIKGGPGCGKSSFMKKIGAAAEKDGLNVQYVWCSGDPDSLDAVYVPARKIGYVDGTAPHVMEVPYPGAGGLYLDLGRFYDRKALQPRLKEIMELHARNQAIYTEAYDLLDQASVWKPHAVRTAKTAAPFSLPAKHGNGILARRFCRALTCRGMLSFPLSDSSPEILPASEDAEQLAQSAAAAGYDVICAQHPIYPEMTEAVFLPETGGYYAADLTELELRLLPLEKRVSEKLRQAKSVHDELEALYNPHVDFDGVYSLAADHIAGLKN